MYVEELAFRLFMLSSKSGSAPGDVTRMLAIYWWLDSGEGKGKVRVLPAARLYGCRSLGQRERDSKKESHGHSRSDPGAIATSIGPRLAQKVDTTDKPSPDWTRRSHSLER